MRKVTFNPIEARTVYSILNTGPQTRNSQGYSAESYRDHQSIFDKFHEACNVEETENGKRIVFEEAATLNLKESEYQKIIALLNGASGMSASLAKTVVDILEYLKERPQEDEKEKS